MPRAFVAVTVQPNQALVRMLEALGRISPVVRPVAHRNLHLTLRFLGETEGSKFADITRAISAASANLLAMDLRLRGLGGFPENRHPEIVWAGIENAGSLSHMVEELGVLLADLGVTGDDRSWHPHLTLARVKGEMPAELIRFIASHAGTELGAIRVEVIQLLTSELRPQGPRYTVASNVPLASRPHGDVPGVKLTPVRVEDLGDLLGLWNDARVMRFTENPKGLGWGSEEAQGWLSGLAGEPLRRHFAVRSGATFCGEASYVMDGPKKSAKVDVKMTMEAAGKGQAIKALGLLVRMAFNANPTIERVWAEVAVEDVSGQKLLTRCGLRAGEDGGRWELTRERWKSGQG